MTDDDQTDLFAPKGRRPRTDPTGDGEADAHAPLAERLRPRTLDEVVGQDHLLGPDKLLRRAIEGDRVPSMILWGPPGSGKTTLARVIAERTRRAFVPFSAVLGGVGEVRTILAEAERRLARGEGGTLLFVDEIHRFNRAQQDAFLPHVERGTVTLIGATTENPSFALNSALISRARVYVLRALGEDELKKLLLRALADEDRGLGILRLTIDDDALEHLSRASFGDARRALGDEHWLTAQAGLSLATALARSGDHAAALSHAARAHARFLALYGPDHPRTRAAAALESELTAP